MAKQVLPDCAAAFAEFLISIDPASLADCTQEDCKHPSEESSSARDLLSALASCTWKKVTEDVSTVSDLTSSFVCTAWDEIAETTLRGGAGKPRAARNSGVSSQCPSHHLP
eukprot:gb/GFBE01058721.1/.p1 GENE.gb/GFBE01058721.1/~~gb/GFBE01058721.1/.p1  ORF type:complete len:111 (+),score=8.44 gb/GFBE01058721.1/:1-333(+)